MSARQKAAIEQREAAKAAERYRQITAAFPVTQTTTDNLKATVVEFRKIAARTAWPEPSFVHLSKVLDAFPQIELESLTWRIGRPGEGGVESTESASSVVTGPVAVLLEVSGKVNTTQRSDYRAITAEVQRFAQALSADSPYKLERTRLPFDITSQGTLTGDIGAMDRGESPRFTVVLARPLK
jgi:hypothetical protein